MIFSISWKNVWRNKIRSLVVIVAVMLGIFGGVMATGIMKGWITQRIHSSIYNEISHVQIHNPDFMLNEELRFTINGYDKVINILDTVPEIEAYSSRVKILAMASSDWAQSALMLKGVNADHERKVSEIHKNMIVGNFLEGNYRTPSIVIGSNAAETLKLLNYQITKEKLDSLDKDEFSSDLAEQLSSIGTKRYRSENDFKKALRGGLSKANYKNHEDELIKYFSFYRLGVSLKISLQDKEGVVSSPVFKVRGVYKTSNSLFDGMVAFVDQKKLNKIIKFSESEVHEIAILTKDNETGDVLGGKLEKYIPQNSVMSWKKISPEIAMYTDFVGVMGLIYVSIILFALSFSIINTMLMSVLERVKELGMLMAIGMNRVRVFFMIMLESIFLTLTGAFAGMFLSGAIIKLTNTTGIDFSMWEKGVESVGYSAIVYPEVDAYDFLLITILVVITGIVSAIWPARKALKLSPVEALRTD